MHDTHKYGLKLLSGGSTFRKSECTVGLIVAFDDRGMTFTLGTRSQRCDVDAGYHRWHGNAEEGAEKVPCVDSANIIMMIYEHRGNKIQDKSAIKAYAD